MKRAVGSFFSRVVAGLVVLFPIVVAGLVISQLLGMLDGLIQAIASLSPVVGSAEIWVSTLISIATVLTVLFLAGSLIAVRGGGRSTWLERRFLNYIPVYPLIRGLVLGAFGRAGGDGPSAGVLRRSEGVEELVVILDRLKDGRRVVYLPNAPTPASGRLLVVAADLVEPVDASLIDALSVFADWGNGVEKVLPPAE